MIWECSECGHLTTRARPPAKCSCCGIAGAIFVPADEASEVDGPGAGLRHRWFEIGFYGAAATAESSGSQTL